MVDRVLVPLFGELPLRAFTPELIDNYRTRLSPKAAGPRTINTYLLVLHVILTRAQRHFALAADPRRRRRAPGWAPPISVSCGGDDWQAMLAAQDAQDAAICTVAAYAGLRLGEIRALRWRDVDFAKRLIHVRRAFTQKAEDVPKSGRARAVPMIDQVLVVLDELSRRERFTGDDDPAFVAPTAGTWRTRGCAGASTPPCGRPASSTCA